MGCPLDDWVDEYWRTHPKGRASWRKAPWLTPDPTTGMPWCTYKCAHLDTKFGCLLAPDKQPVCSLALVATCLDLAARLAKLETEIAQIRRGAQPRLPPKRTRGR